MSAKALSMCFSGRVLRYTLPKGQTFWRIYAPVIRALKDSREHDKIRQVLSIGLDLGLNDVLLDAGCGRADFAIESAFKVRRVIGIDSEPRMIKGAGKKIHSLSPHLSSRIALEVGNLASILYGDRYFTKIASILVLGYVEEREKVLDELVRVLAEGGKLAIVTPRKGASFFKVLRKEAKIRRAEGTFWKNIHKLPLSAIAADFGVVAQLKDKVGQWHFYTEKELVSELERRGLRILFKQSVYADQAILVIAEKPVKTPSLTPL